MKTGNQGIIEQIDKLLEEFDKLDHDNLPFNEQTKFRTRLRAAVRRYTPPNSSYTKDLEDMSNRASDWWLAGPVLRAIRDDYAAGYLHSVMELIHADLFSDFLEMADHLMEQGYKDPAAVIAGSVLEEHLRKLCDKNGSIDVKKPDGASKKADSLNSELAGATVYSKLDQKNVTSWLDLRNKAAHGRYTEYTKDQVALLIQSIRDFITRNPA